jgi:hypothetical protein
MLTLPALLLLVTTAVAQEPSAELSCPSLGPPPERLQVAWISPVRKRVWGRTTLAVVRVGQLRTFVQAQGADLPRTLQALGIVGPRGRVHKRYKITLFDVGAEQLCRPVEHTPEGEESDGLPACAGGRSVGVRRTTGCGTTTDTATDGPGLDLYELPWREAARNGFCVMPLERFLEGA